MRLQNKAFEVLVHKCRVLPGTCVTYYSDIEDKLYRHRRLPGYWWDEVEDRLHTKDLDPRTYMLVDDAATRGVLEHAVQHFSQDEGAYCIRESWEAEPWVCKWVDPVKQIGAYARGMTRFNALCAAVVKLGEQQT